MARQTFANMKSMFMGRLLEEEPDTHANLITLARDGRIEDMFSMMWNLDLAHECLTPNQQESEKSEADALQKLDEGKNLDEEGKHDEALRYYNEGIMCAPHPPIKEDSELGSSSDTHTMDAVERKISDSANELLISEYSSDEDSETAISSVDSSEDFEHVQVKSECSSSEDDFERLSQAEAGCGDNDSSVNSSEEELTEEGFALVKPQNTDEKCVVG